MGVHVVGVRQVGLGDRSPTVEYRGKAPVGGLQDKVPQKPKKNVKLVYNVNVFLQII